MASQNSASSVSVDFVVLIGFVGFVASKYLGPPNETAAAIQFVGTAAALAGIVVGKVLGELTNWRLVGVTLGMLAVVLLLFILFDWTADGPGLGPYVCLLVITCGVFLALSALATMARVKLTMSGAGGAD